MSKTLKTNQPCPDCSSSDGLAVYENGTYCFSCRKTTGEGKANFKNLNKVPSDYALNLLNFEGVYTDLTHRGITKETCERFNVKAILGFDGTSLEKVIYPGFIKGNLAMQKYRDMTYKKGRWLGRTLEDGTTLVPEFFGQHLWEGGGKVLTITEGEYDAMAVYQMAGNFPVVSLPDGVMSVTKTVEGNAEWLQKFDTVKICFDSDTQGTEAAKEIAKILPNNRIELITLTHYKDANDYLKHGKTKEFKQEWWAGQIYQPPGLLGGSERFDDLFVSQKSYYAPYPFRGLNKEALGLRTGEMVTLIAGAGSGKSSCAAEILNTLRIQTDFNIGLMFLEESVKKTKLRMMSLEAGKNLEILEYIRELKRFEQENPNLSIEDNWLRQALVDKFPKMMADPEILEIAEDVDYLKQLHDTTIGAKDVKGRDRFVLFDHFGSNDIETISGLIRAMVKTHGCKYIFLDHISILVSDQENGDERKALDEIATKLRTLVQNLDIGLVMVAHLKRSNGKPHEEGGKTSLADIRGTAGIGQLSDLVLGLERNGQADCPIERNITTIRVVKNRKFGNTGVACRVHYNADSGRMHEVDELDIEMLIAEESGKVPEFDDEDVSVFDSTSMGSSTSSENTSLQKDRTLVEIKKIKKENQEEWTI